MGKDGTSQSRPSLLRLRKRAEFLRVRRGRRVSRPGFTLEARPNDQAGMRFGVTATKKLGNAVIRNRAKRRMRALLATALPESGQPNMDYVLIARPPVLTREYAGLLDDLRTALVDPRLIGGSPSGSSATSHV